MNFTRNERLDNTLRHIKRLNSERVPGFVYVIACRGFFKIGIAQDVGQRLAMLQIGNPFDLVLLRSFPSNDPARDEETLHLALWKWRRRGEWFELPPSVLANLVALPTLAAIRRRSFPGSAAPASDWQI